MYCMKNRLLLVLLILSSAMYGQIKKPALLDDGGMRNLGFDRDSARFNKEVRIKLSGETHYTDYKIIRIDSDSSLVDTTLSMKKAFKINHLRTDDFERLPFHNQGQTYNKLAYDFEGVSLFPGIGFSAKQYPYKAAEDIYYYHVPTPTSELMYQSGMEQGQVLESFLTMNLSKNLNISIGYKGLRSLGKYRHALASHGNFSSSVNYLSDNKKYAVRTHFASFDFFNQENGGLTDLSINYFESGDPNYIERARLDVQYTNAETMFKGKRFFLDHVYTLYSKKLRSEAHNQAAATARQKLTQLKRSIKRLSNDSLQRTENQPRIDSLTAVATFIEADSARLTTINFRDRKERFLKIGHRFTYEKKQYSFDQQTANSLYGDAFTNSIDDLTKYRKFDNRLYTEFRAPLLGKLRASLGHYSQQYHYNSILFYDSHTISNKLTGQALSLEADWKTQYKHFHINAQAATGLGGNLRGNSLKAAAFIKKDSLYELRAFAEITNRSPDLNKQLYQSDYQDYNWQNSFNNELISNIGLAWKSEKWGKLKAQYYLIDQYTYFDENALPVQADIPLAYLKIRAHKAISLGKFTLDNTLMYQQVAKGSSFFRVPRVVTRNSFYFADHLFKGDPLYIQTGFTFKYFSKFKAGAYNPVLSEFILQNHTEIGDYPLIDFFVNAQIQRTRLYFKVENISADYTGRNYYAAPRHPYRDLTVRFGLVWNFFI